MDNQMKEGAYWVVSEAAFYAFLFYIQVLLKVDGNLWVSSLVLWMLLNVSIIFCPVVRKCFK